MITPINSATPVNNITQNNQGERYYISSPHPISTPIGLADDFFGLHKLANYNKPLVNRNIPKFIQPSLPTVLQPEAIKAIKGDRIYSSTGTLDSIISKNDKTTTVYKMDDQAPQDAIRRIEVFDNKTGRIIRTQENFNIIEKNKLPRMEIIEIKDYRPEFSKPFKTTIYYKGQLEMVSENKYGPDNYRKYSVVSAKDLPMVEEDFGDAGLRTTTKFDKEGYVDSIAYTYSKDMSRKTIYYKNGVPSKVINETSSPIINTTGINPKDDLDIRPALPYDLDYYPMALPGERTYYSNGALEGIKTQTSNDGGYVIHKFRLNGTLEGILDNTDPNHQKSILFFPNSYSIEENNGNKVRHTTVFNDDGTQEVSWYDENNKIQKYATYYKEGSLASYLEIAPDGNRVLMTYNKAGELIGLS